jgi:hypothetical protein
VKILAVVVALLLVIGVCLLVYQAQPAAEEVLVPGSDEEGSAPGPREEASPPDLEERIRRLEDRLDFLERRSRANAGGIRPMAPEGKGRPDSAPRIEEVHDALPHLEKYRESFRTDERGSEYFRLAVDAYAVQLLDEITAAIRSESEPSPYRCRLIEMLGSKRFIANRTAVACLLDVLASSDPSVVGASLGSLRIVGGAEAGPAIEKRVWSMANANLRRTALAVLVHCTATDANHALFRLFSTATDDAGRVLTLGHVSPGETRSALEIFRAASALTPTVRTQAAHRIGNFRDPAFKEFLDAWIRSESDPAVLRALNTAKQKQSRIPNYHPMKLTGPPDANPHGDHPNAWAARQAEMGLVWLELWYKDPMPATEIRVHEVYVAGAVVEAIAIDPQGRRHTVWKGTDPTKTPGVFSIRFARTAYSVSGVRIVIDTNAKSGWEEVDAVELVGPGGRRWAYRATASTTYAR